MCCLRVGGLKLCKLNALCLYNSTFAFSYADVPYAHWIVLVCFVCLYVSCVPCCASLHVCVLA